MACWCKTPGAYRLFCRHPAGWRLACVVGRLCSGESGLHKPWPLGSESLARIKGLVALGHWSGRVSGLSHDLAEWSGVGVSHSVDGHAGGLGHRHHTHAIHDAGGNAGLKTLIAHWPETRASGLICRLGDSICAGLICPVAGPA